MRHPLVTEDLLAILGEKLAWARFDGKTILVTGANGMLPACMVEALLFLNERRPECRLQVIGLVRSLERAIRRFRAYEGRGDLMLLEQDVCDPLPPDIAADFVIHAASQASPRYFGTDPVGTLKANVLGTANMLELARRCGSERMLFFSSSEVYGQSKQQEVSLRETEYFPLDPLSVRNCYGESKRMGECMCAAWAVQHGVSVSTVRAFHTYGPGMRMDDGRVFADFVADALSGRPISVKSDGCAVRSYCYLSDAVRGFFGVLLNGGVAEAYNIGNPYVSLSVAQLARLLSSLASHGVTPVVYEKAHSADAWSNPITTVLPCIDKVRGELGWEPRVGAREGFARTLAIANELAER